MLFGIVDYSTSFSPSTSASPILKLFEIRRTRSKCPRCPRAIRSCWQRSSLQRWLCGDFRWRRRRCRITHHATTPFHRAQKAAGLVDAVLHVWHNTWTQVMSQCGFFPVNPTNGYSYTSCSFSQGKAHTLPKLPSKGSRKCVFEFNLLNPPHASLHNTTATAPQSIWIRHCIIHQWKWPASSVRLLPAALLPASPRQLLLVAPFIACSK